MINFLLGAIFRTQSGEYEYLNPTIEFLNTYIVPITICLVVASGLMAVIYITLMMKGENPDKMSESKKRLIGMFITMGCVLIAVWALGAVLSNYSSIMATYKSIFQGLSS